MIELLLCLIIATSCDIISPKETTKYPLLRDVLEKRHTERLQEFNGIKNKENGWIDLEECDAMLWNGLAVCGGADIDLTKAEYEHEKGRFNRRPRGMFCGGDQNGDSTTWSRDMGMGLYAGLYCKKEFGTLMRHLNYGKEHNWLMGLPLADGRVVYTPSMIGIGFQVLYKISGEDSPNRVWPSIYSKGLDDYEAHLQMLDIWLRGEVDERAKDASLTEINSLMLDRVEEHASREPNCPFYQAINGIYTGDYSKAMNLLIQSNGIDCQYIRNDQDALADWLFTAKVIIKNYDENTR